MGEKHRWLVCYSTDTNPCAYLIVWCEERKDVRYWLKRHLGNERFKINRITEEVVNYDG